MKNDFFIVLCSIFFATFAVFIFPESRMMIFVTQLNKLLWRNLDFQNLKLTKTTLNYLSHGSFTTTQFINAVFM